MSVCVCVGWGGGAVAQAVVRATSVEEVPGSIPAVAARFLLVGSVSGSQNLLKIPPRANKKCTEKAFKHCAPYIWNSLPSDIREAKSESQFKNYLKTHLFKSHLCI